MLRLLRIEWFKLRHSRYFWALFGLFVLVLLGLPLGVRGFLVYLTSQGESILRLDISAVEIPLYDFVDIWQNQAWIYTLFSLFLGFIPVISVGNEYSYGTIRQNVIDGLSPSDLFWSKVLFMLVLALVVTFITGLIGLVTGYLWSPVTEWSFVVQNMKFLPAYGLHLLAFQLLCLVVVLLIKRTGIVMALLTFYIYGVEFIAQGILRFKLEWELAAKFLPGRATHMLIPNPFPKYILQETITTIPLDGLLLAIGSVILYGGLAYMLLTRRDLN
ncbi:MAG: hypothetical protein D6722_18790 [Bacteroidetes bacterium]|nr:MAG: hypothetical protein D6722_18790 [Bacteroidota bacterium]